MENKLLHNIFVTRLQKQPKTKLPKWDENNIRYYEKFLCEWTLTVRKIRISQILMHIWLGRSMHYVAASACLAFPSEKSYPKFSEVGPVSKVSWSKLSANNLRNSSML